MTDILPMSKPSFFNQPGMYDRGLRLAIQDLNRFSFEQLLKYSKTPEINDEWDRGWYAGIDELIKRKMPEGYTFHEETE